MSQLPLQGIRVIDLTRLIPGPFCTSIMADMGAEVIKLEDPKLGDYERDTKPLLMGMGYRFRMLNTNKKSLAVNLKDPLGKGVFLKLLKSADIVVEGFRPGVMKKMGLDYENLKKAKPGIIYCSLSSYGNSGPKRDIIAHDLNILAETGLLDLIGTETGAPAIPGIQIADSVTSLYATIAILGALTSRAKTGKGAYLDLSMHDCCFALMFDAMRNVFAGEEAPQRGRERLTGGLANYAVYKTSDGKYLAIGSLEKKFKDELLKLVGLENMIEKSGAVTTGSVVRRNENKVKNKLKKIFAQKTQSEWMELLGPANICVSPVQTVSEAAQDPQLLDRGMITQAPLCIGQEFRTIGSPIAVAGTKSNKRLPAPKLGEYTVEVLLHAGFPLDEVKSLINKGIISNV